MTGQHPGARGTRSCFLIDIFLLIPKVTFGLTAAEPLRHPQNPRQDSSQSPRHGHIRARASRSHVTGQQPAPGQGQH